MIGSRRLWLPMLAALAVLANPNGAALAQSASSPRPEISVTTGGAFVSSVTIETEGHLIVIDPGSSPDDARHISVRSAALGKPVHSVLITHAHVDHYGAVEPLRAGGARFVAGAGVARQLREYDAINYARFGASPRPGSHVPDAILGDGQSVSVDGVRVTLHELGPGESYSDVWYLIETPSGRSAVVGDMAMYGLPPFMQSGHSRDWINSLRQLQRDIPDGVPIIIGHDRRTGDTGDPFRDKGVLAWQIARIEAFREAVAAVTGGARLLTVAEIEGVIARLHLTAPEYLPGFDFLIRTTANIVAAELILDAQKAAFETALGAELKARARVAPRRGS